LSTVGDLEHTRTPQSLSTVGDIYSFRMAETRPRDAAQTRADILAAARRRFAAEGFERTTLRAIAADVGVDAALVIRYFGSKQDLFATATEFTIELVLRSAAASNCSPCLIVSRSWMRTCTALTKSPDEV
jgi:DNA-binding transcriptional regulator YbjK